MNQLPVSSSVFLRYVGALLMLLAGCGDGSLGNGYGGGSGTKGGGGGGGGGGTPSDLGLDLAGTPDLMPYQTAFPPPPPLILAGANQVLTTPAVVPVFFSSDALQSQLMTFLQAYVTSVPSVASWAVLAEYGVGAGTVGSAVVLATPASNALTDQDVQNLLSKAITAGTLPVPGAQTLYALFFPQNIGVTLLSGGVSSASCTNFAGYHQDFAGPTGVRVSYAVVARCAPVTLNQVTATAAHELAELATDPAINSYNTMSTPYALWVEGMQGTEVADLCNGLVDAALPISATSTDAVVRLWSNTAAVGRHNPCQPAPAGSDFFSIPILTELDQVNVNGTIYPAEAVPVSGAVTKSVTVNLLATTAPSPTWTVTAAEVPAPGNRDVLALTWKEAVAGKQQVTGQSGGVFHLYVTPSSVPVGGYTFVQLTSTATLATGPTQTQWSLAVHVY